MAKIIKNTIIMLLVLILGFSAVPGMQINASAVSFDDINIDSVFLKQETAVTCTLASAAMMLRRTAMIAGFSDWEEITEPNLRDTAWVDGVGLRWDFTFYGMTVGHGYYPKDTDKKQFMIELLKKYPQGVVVYNTGKGDQTHAVFLTDYVEKEDMFYVSDPTSTVSPGRIKLTESSIVGKDQAEQIDNLSAYWYISAPEVTFKNGEFTSSGNVSNPYDPTHDSHNFDQSKTAINKYYVVNYDSKDGVAVRYYPSGSSSAAKYVKKGTILYVLYKGKNYFGAEWYKLSSGHYIFSTNIIPFEEYSEEIIKFNNTASAAAGTYKVSATDGSASMRIEPSEGNNIVAELAKDKLLYITHTGVNSVGAKWYKTQEGYYVKASDMTLVSDKKLANSAYTGKYETVSGSYNASPVEDGFVSATYKVTASSLNLRSEPVSGTVYAGIPKDSVVEVTEIKDGWGKITYNGFVGWISLEYAERVKTQEVYAIEALKLSATSVAAGNKITCTATVTGCAAPTYTFHVYNSSGKNVYSSSKTNKNSIDFSTLTSGEYYFFVEVRNEESKRLTKFSGNFIVYDKLQLKSVKSDADEYSLVSEKITWTAQVASTSSDAVYIYSLYCDDKLLLEKESSINLFQYIPEKAGKYVLSVVLSDKYSKSEKLSSEAVTVCDKLRLDEIKLPAKYIIIGKTASFSAVTSGGAGELQYCFTVFRDGSIVNKAAYSTASEYEFIFEEEGIYRLFCSVTDSEKTLVSGYSDEVNVIAAVRGDVDGDAKVSAKDARTVLRYSAKLEQMDEQQQALAEVTGDGKVTSADARIILRCAAKLEEINI